MFPESVDEVVRRGEDSCHVGEQDSKARFVVMMPRIREGRGDSTRPEKSTTKGQQERGTRTQAYTAPCPGQCN